ncbi:hypothetical protein Trydic_g26 [Trypoxylus dichotomus]
MNFVIILFSLISVLLLTNGNPATVKVVGPTENGAILQGPATKIIIKGPDGTVISTVANAGSVASPGHQGGVIVSREKPAGVVHLNRYVPAVATAPIVAHVTLPFIYAAPVHGYGHGFNTVLIHQPHA